MRLRGGREGGGEGLQLTEADLEAAPVGGEDLAERRAAWDARRIRWDRIRQHERAARVHRRLAEQHAEAASKHLSEVEA